MAEENKLRVLSSPMLVASNNQPAHLFIGDERVLVVGASSESTTGTTGATNTTITVETEKRDVGQTLSILPRINGDRSVSLTIDQDSSTVKVGDTTLPISTADGDIIYYPIDTVNTATLQVTAHAKDGMTVAVGGMIRNSTQFDEQKVPVLGDIPVFGALFKRDIRASERTQIVLLITPRVLENPEEADRLAKQKESDFEQLDKSAPDLPIIPDVSDWQAITVGNDTEE
jgi:type II secretory pathway component GspD/PulD (secretin)